MDRKVNVRSARIFRARGMTQAWRKGYKAGYHEGWKVGQLYMKKRVSGQPHYVDKFPWKRQSYLANLARERERSYRYYNYRNLF